MLRKDKSHGIENVILKSFFKEKFIFILLHMFKYRVILIFIAPAYQEALFEPAQYAHPYYYKFQNKNHVPAKCKSTTDSWKIEKILLKHVFP